MGRTDRKTALADKARQALPYLLAVLGPAILFSTVLAWARVSGSSMAPGMRDGDFLLCVRHAAVTNGDEVVFRQEGYGIGEALVKRVIATEGQTVQVSGGTAYVDGAPVQEGYASLERGTGPDFGPEAVPEGCVFVLGDNRGASMDSRDSRIGFVGLDRIIGKAVLHIGGS